MDVKLLWKWIVIQKNEMFLLDFLIFTLTHDNNNNNNKEKRKNKNNNPYEQKLELNEFWFLVKFPNAWWNTVMSLAFIQPHLLSHSIVSMHVACEITIRKLLIPFPKERQATQEYIQLYERFKYHWFFFFYIFYFSVHDFFCHCYTFQFLSIFWIYSLKHWISAKFIIHSGKWYT